MRPVVIHRDTLLTLVDLSRARPDKICKTTTCSICSNHQVCKLTVTSNDTGVVFLAAARNCHGSSAASHSGRLPLGSVATRLSDRGCCQPRSVCLALCLYLRPYVVATWKASQCSALVWQSWHMELKGLSEVCVLWSQERRDRIDPDRSRTTRNEKLSFLWILWQHSWSSGPTRLLECLCWCSWPPRTPPVVLPRVVVLSDVYRLGWQWHLNYRDELSNRSTLAISVSATPTTMGLGCSNLLNLVQKADWSFSLYTWGIPLTPCHSPSWPRSGCIHLESHWTNRLVQ